MLENNFVASKKKGCSKGFTRDGRSLQSMSEPSSSDKNALCLPGHNLEPPYPSFHETAVSTGGPFSESLSRFHFTAALRDRTCILKNLAVELRLDVFVVTLNKASLHCECRVSQVSL